MDTNCCLLNQISTANVAFRFSHELEVIKEEFHSDRFDCLKIQEWTDFLGFSFREFGGEYTNVQNRFDEIEKKIFPNYRVEDAEKHALFQCFPHPNLLEELFRRSLNEGFIKFLLLFETVLFAGFHQVTTINSGFPLRNPALLESVLFSAIFTKNLLSPFYSLSTAESRFSEDPNVGFYESFERLLSFRAYVSGLDEAEIVSSVDESKGKPDRPLFLISDSSAQRRDFIRRLTSTEPAAAGHLAWADFEWTVRRAIHLLSENSTADGSLGTLTKKFISLPELEQCWDDQVRPKFGRPLSVVVPDWDYLINESSKLRTLDIHRIGRELEGHFICDAVESVLSATKSVIDHVAETGKDIFTHHRFCGEELSSS